MRQLHLTLLLSAAMSATSAFGQDDAQPPPRQSPAQPAPAGGEPRDGKALGQRAPGRLLPGERRAERSRGDGFFARMAHLMPPAFAHELNLDPEQEKQISALETEFRKKRQEILIQTGFQVFAIIDNLGEEEEQREPAPVLAIAHEITGGLLESRRLRAGFEKKMLALLNPEQREQFIDLKEQPLFGRQAREDDRERRGGGELHPLSPRVQRSLDLTDEQRKQLVEMRQQWDTQFRNLLTQEQRERWERLTRSGRPPAVRGED
jgi:Spy/CpxP family protein refolding chaperone